ncbi:TolC family outer membrane protein [Pelagibacteraceae bacterium]|nr:TolC family outer membrane protein [Pelagibacteraceae bacterium]
MKLFIFLTFLIFNSNTVYATSDLLFFLDSAFKNNPKLNAERQKLKATEQNINISKSEFLPSISIEGSVDGTNSTNRTNQSGVNLPDTSTDTESKKISIDQKIFQGFEGYNSLKKSKLEVSKAKYSLRDIEQDTLYQAANAYFDFIYKKKSSNFNLENVSLFERQVETDSVRLQKGEITLTDLAQSESSLAGASANLISAKTVLLTARTNFERIIGTSVPETIIENFVLNVNLPTNLAQALEISKKNNPKLLVAKIDYEISEKEVHIEKAKLSPSASINFSKSKNDDFSSSIDKTDQETVKATVTWPIIRGGKNYSSIKKSKFKREESNLILKDTENEIKTETTNAWSVYQSAISVFNATKAQVKAAEIANEGITLEYNSGNKRTTIEVIQSRTLLLGAKIANAEAEKELMLSKFKLLAILGNLKLENINNS